MTTGGLSPWGRGASDAADDPHAASYDGPWGAPAPPAPWPSPLSPPSPPSWSGPTPFPVTEEQLRQLPPPVVAARPAALDQRPAVIGLSVTLSVTASLLWVCGLSLFLLVAVAGTQAMSPVGEDGFVFHTLDEVVLRMGDGLWVPLYGFPVVSVITGFLVLLRRPWTRLAHSFVGATSLGWAAWWLRDSLLMWVVVAVYVAIAVTVLWVPSVGRWYAGRPTRPSRGRTLLDG